MVIHNIFFTSFTPTKDDLKSLRNLVDAILDELTSVETEHHLFGLSFAIICYQVVKGRSKVTAVNCTYTSKMKCLVT